MPCETSRILTYSEVRDLCGSEVANKLFGMHYEPHIDLDNPGDFESATNIANEREAAERPTALGAFDVVG